MNLKSENVSNVSSVHIKPEEFKNAVHFGESHDYCDAVVFQKHRFQNVFRPHENEIRSFQISPWKDSSRKAPFS